MTSTRELAAGIGFTEGPVRTADGRLLVTSMSRGQIGRIDPDGGGVLATVETGGGPNGLCQAPDGRLWVAQNGATIVASRSERPASPGLQAIDGDTVTDVVTSGLRAPNDLIPGPDGRIWFTDPRPPDAGEKGTVHAFDPATGALATVAEGIDYPNGLVFDAAGTTLLVAETTTGRVLRFTRDGARLEPDGVFATLRAGGPDGLALLADGTLLAASPAADLVAVFDPDGTPREEIPLPGAFPTNVCLAGDRDEWLVVTAPKGGRVLVTEAPRAGGERP